MRSTLILTLLARSSLDVGIASSFANRLLSFGLGLLLGALSGRGADRSGLLQEDFPFQGACIGARLPGHNVALKGLAIRVGNGASVLFDTELLRMAAGWTGGYITTRGVAFDGEHGEHPQIDGEQKFGTSQSPGWADAHGAFADPRAEPYGPLPDSWAHWDGLYVHGTNVVLSYTVHGTTIHEQPSSVAREAQVGFVRTFKIETTKDALTMVVCEVEGATGKTEDNQALLIMPHDKVTVAGAVGLPARSQAADRRSSGSVAPAQRHACHDVQAGPVEWQ